MPRRDCHDHHHRAGAGEIRDHPARIHGNQRRCCWRSRLFVNRTAVTSPSDTAAKSRSSPSISPMASPARRLASGSIFVLATTSRSPRRRPFLPRPFEDMPCFSPHHPTVYSNVSPTSLGASALRQRKPPNREFCPNYPWRFCAGFPSRPRTRQPGPRPGSSRAPVTTRILEDRPIQSSGKIKARNEAP